MKIQAKTLLQALKAVAPNMSNDETRAHINGVRFEFSKGKLRLVATDGHTLAMADLPQAIDHDFEQVEPVTIQAADVKALIKLLGKKGEVELSFSASTVTFSHDGATRCCIVVDMAYPPYENVIPKPGAPSRRIDKNDEKYEDSSLIALPVIGLNPAYLARVGKACVDFCGGAAAARSAYKGLKMDIGGELDPVRFDYEAEIGTLVLVVMPMRI